MASKPQIWRRLSTGDEHAEEPQAPAETGGQTPGPEVLLEERDRKIAELIDQLKRLQADFDNYKKRTEREYGERSKLAGQKLMAELLPLLDSFEKALENTDEGTAPQDLRKGLEGLYRQFLQTLQKEGLREIRTDCRLDPFIHEAMMREEREDADDGVILEVFQKGYCLNGKTLRPARVKVAKRKEPEDKELQSQDTEVNAECEDDEKQE